VVWTEAKARGHGLLDIVRWMCTATARLAGLSGRKGVIAVGADADLCVFADDEQVTIDAATLRHRHPVTPYAGATLTGRVHATYLRGRRVYDGRDVDGVDGQLL